MLSCSLQSGAWRVMYGYLNRSIGNSITGLALRHSAIGTGLALLATFFTLVMRNVSVYYLAASLRL